uniref:BAH domain-containing protein n=1 Tax=Hyaloperonospora arabidopsidis (strain Emoy2) TaxID=559515 RepID=M4BV35_HYAAE
MASAPIGRNEHTASPDESQEPIVDQQPRSADGNLILLNSRGKSSLSEISLPRRVTRACVKQLVVTSDSESDSSRSRGASKVKANDAAALKSDNITKGNSGVLLKDEMDSDDSDAPGDHINVQVGDCVMLDSGNPDDSYVALVSSVQFSQRHDRFVSSFMAQWYYKPYDVKEEVKATIKGGVLENEVFLSPHKDSNSIDAVMEICQVVSPEEYADIQDEIKRGFRERGKTYFVCRYKYYPNRSNIRKALEAVENRAIRNGLGRLKPNVGSDYQATVPKCVEAVSSVGSVGDSIVPWKTREEPSLRPRQVWSPLAAEAQYLIYVQFRGLVDTLRFAVGNIVKTYRPISKPTGHKRGIVLQYSTSDSVQICASTGQVLTVLKSELCSPLTEDLAMQELYLSRFNLTQAAYGCSKTILCCQREERMAFRYEVELYAKAKAAAAAATKSECSFYEEDRRKRKK